MALQYSLVPNELTPDPNDCRAKIENMVKNSIDKIVAQLTVSGSIFKEPETKAIIVAFLNQLKTNLKEGVGFSSEYFDLEPSIQGVFTTETDRFDDSRHTKAVNMILRSQFTEALDSMQIQYLSGVELLPVIRRVFDVLSNTINTTITPGGTLELEGDLLSFDAEKTEQGVFFLNTTTNTETRTERVYRIYRKSLSLVVPELVAGTYQLIVRNPVFSKENMREGKLKVLLTVN